MYKFIAFGCSSTNLQVKLCTSKLLLWHNIKIILLFLELSSIATTALHRRWPSLLFTTVPPYSHVTNKPHIR